MDVEKCAELKQLFHNFYCEILNLYKTEKPLCTVEIYKKYLDNDSNECQNKVLLKVSGLNYVDVRGFDKRAQKIHALDSFKKLNLILNNESNINFGTNIFCIFAELYQQNNLPCINELTNEEIVEFNLKPVPLNEFKFDVQKVSFSINNNSLSIPNEKYYYFLQNFFIRKDLDFLLDGMNVAIKSLASEEIEAFINSGLIESNIPFQDVPRTVRVAIITNAKLEYVQIKNILTLCRIYKKGDFRLCAIANSKTGIANNLIFDYSNDNLNQNLIELNLRKPYTSHSYNLAEFESENLKSFIINNYHSNKNYVFAWEIISSLYSLEEKFRIACNFFVLESFFPRMRENVTSKLPDILTLILNENPVFTKKVKDLYDLRSRFVHGSLFVFDSDEKINKFNKKLKKISANYNNINDCIDDLEKIVKDVWKVILSHNFTKEEDVEKFFLKIYSRKKQKLFLLGMLKWVFQVFVKSKRS